MSMLEWIYILYDDSHRTINRRFDYCEIARRITELQDSMDLLLPSGYSCTISLEHNEPIIFIRLVNDYSRFVEFLFSGDILNTRLNEIETNKVIGVFYECIKTELMESEK